MVKDIESQLLTTPSSLKRSRSSINTAVYIEADSKLCVGIIGTGNYAIALTKRLAILGGCDVIIGSRNPKARILTLMSAHDFLSGVEITTVAECAQKGEIVFVALRLENFKDTLEPISEQLAGKIVVDVSNRETRHAKRSNAEYMASILPTAKVVKAFNSISAFAMEDVGESGNATSRVGYVAGDDPESRRRISELGQSMGFRMTDRGQLSSALSMEDFMLNIFDSWKKPFILASAIFFLWSLHIIYDNFVDRDKPTFVWEQLFLRIFNKPLSLTALTMLAITYLPGQLASVLQVYYGTKHRRFPNFMDAWLKARKQLGVVAFLLATIHAIASVLMISPTYYSPWFHKATVTIPAGNSTLDSDLVLYPTTSFMTWQGEGVCVLGILAFVTLSVVALTSIQSVGDALNWSEWRFVHSTLSYTALALATGHVCVMGVTAWIKPGFFPFRFVLSRTYLCVQLPFLALFLKVIFSVPPLSGYLGKIRRGWERIPPLPETNPKPPSAVRSQH